MLRPQRSPATAKGLRRVADHDFPAALVHRAGKYAVARHHIGGLLASYCAAALACGTATTIKVLVFSDIEPLPPDALGIALTVVLSMFWFTVAAALFVLPAALVGYPIAIVIVRRGAGLPVMIASGALLGPTIGSFATLGCVSLLAGSGPASWLASAEFLAPAASAGGAAMAWAVAKRDANLDQSHILPLESQNALQPSNRESRTPPTKP